MSKRRHTEAQMIGAVKQWEAGCKVVDVARELGVSRQTMYTWKAKYDRMGVSQRLRDENAYLRKLLAQLRLEVGFNVEDVARELECQKK